MDEKKNLSFFKDWNTFELLLFGFNYLFAFIFFIYSFSQNHWINDWTIDVAFIGNFANITSVILCTKKRVSCFAWGIVAVILFGYIAFNAHAFGNMLLYWGFYIPAQIVAWVLWYRSSEDKKEIKPKKIKWWGILITFVIAIGLIIGFFFIEYKNTDFQKWWFGGDQHYDWYHSLLDSSIFILSLTMTIFVWMRFRERWIVSIVIDTIQSIFWILMTFGIGFGNQFNPTYLIMFISTITMLVSAIYGVINWRR